MNLSTTVKQFWSLWTRASKIGVAGLKNRSLARKIELTNKISLTISILLPFLGISLFLASDLPSTMLLAVTAVTLVYASPMLLNSLGRTTLSRMVLNYLPPIFLTFGTCNMGPGGVDAMRFSLVSVILIPVLIFGIDEALLMVAGFVWVVAAFAGLDLTVAWFQRLDLLPISPIDRRLFTLANGALSCSLFGLAFVYYQRLVHTTEKELARQKERAESLLLNILPEPVAQLLQQNRQTIADQYEGVSILFADIVGFTGLSSRLSPQEVVALLNDVFTHFDVLVDQYGLEKIKTNGDCYMVAAGVPAAREDHAQALVRLALDVQQHVSEMSFGGHRLSFRIGINSGPVIAGVIGRKRFIYDLWGDAVNVASRMESHGVAGCIQITRDTWELVRDQFRCERQGSIEVKGKGPMDVWHVLGPVA